MRFFFFFQAEDGIRDHCVTGVQTCALPISPHAIVKRFRKISSGHISTGASRWEIGVFYILSRLRLERLVRPAYDALQVPLLHRGILVVTPRFVRAAHAR